MSNSLSAAPVGCRRPRSQLIAVTGGIFKRAAKTGWLTLSRLRIARTWAGVNRLTRGGNGMVLVRRVSLRLPCTWSANDSTLPTRSSALNSMSFVFMAVFLFDDFDCGLQATLLVGREVLGLGFRVDVEKDNRVVPRHIKVDDPGAALPTLSVDGHAHFAKTAESWDEVSLFGILQEVILELAEVGIISELRNQAGKQRQLDEGEFHLTHTA